MAVSDYTVVPASLPEWAASTQKLIYLPRRPSLYALHNAPHGLNATIIRQRFDDQMHMIRHDRVVV